MIVLAFFVTVGTEGDLADYIRRTRLDRVRYLFDGHGCEAIARSDVEHLSFVTAPDRLRAAVGGDLPK